MTGCTKQTDLTNATRIKKSEAKAESSGSVTCRAAG